MSEPASISTGIASRYAKAVFEMAREDNAIATLEADLDTLAAALQSSEDFRSLVNSPIYSREEMGRAVGAVAQSMELSQTMKSTLGLMAAKRRLFVLPQLVAALRGMIAEEKGEVTADVTSAAELTAEQTDKLAAALKKAVGKDVKINAAVDEKLIGGLIVKVGSKMIDTSIRSKLANLQNAMKEVG